MQDTLISFETAVLAKEKGFDIHCFHFYTKQNSKMFGIDEKGRYYHIKNKFKKLYTCGEEATLNVKNVISAPTQSLLQKWIREKHNIVVLVEHGMLEDNSFGYFCRIYPEIKNTAKQFKIFEYSKSYEQALEKGLYKSLKLIKQFKV